MAQWRPCVGGQEGQCGFAFISSFVSRCGFSVPAPWTRGEQSRDSKTASGLLKDDRASSSVAAERSSYAIEFNRGEHLGSRVFPSRMYIPSILPLGQASIRRPSRDFHISELQVRRSTCFISGKASTISCLSGQILCCCQDHQSE